MQIEASLSRVQLKYIRNPNWPNAARSTDEDQQYEEFDQSNCEIEDEIATELGKESVEGVNFYVVDLINEKR